MSKNLVQKKRNKKLFLILINLKKNKIKYSFENLKLLT